jgi:hypothetical protein
MILSLGSASKREVGLGWLCTLGARYACFEETKFRFNHFQYVFGKGH